MNRLQSFKMRVKEVITVLPAALLLACAVVGSVMPERAYAAVSSVPEEVPSVGKDFWLTFMQNIDATADNAELELKLIAISKSDGTITISTTDGSETEVQSLTANDAFEYIIPSAWRSKIYNTASDTKRMSGLHVTSDVDIALYMQNGKYSNAAANSYDYSQVFPVAALGQDYVTSAYYRDQINTEFAVIAVEDGTEITIVTSCRTVAVGGTLNPAGQTIVKSLNKGEVYFLKGEGYRGQYKSNISGTTIGASKPVAVFNGNMRAVVPYRVGSFDGDHLFEQSLPINAWGKRFVLMNMSAFPDAVTSLSGDYSPTEFSVTAIYPGTTEVKVNGVLVKTLNAGETTSLYNPLDISVRWNETPKILETSQPVAVHAFMVNSAHNTYLDEYEDPYGFGEPSMSIVPDVSKGMKEVKIDCNEANASVHYANVVVAVEGKDYMMLDGVSIANKFTTLSSTFENQTQQYAYARIALSDGEVHTISNAEKPFVTIQYSVGDGEINSWVSQSAVVGLNLAPAAPKLMIDTEVAVHLDTLEYCNQHPGVQFKAFVDYPHDSVRWYLGEGATSMAQGASQYNEMHMYGSTISESDTTHNVRLFVYRHTPITNIKDTDSISVVLRVHPVYYDTLETWVTAKALQYEWINSSLHAFSLLTRGEYDLRYKDGDPANGPAVTDLNGRTPAIVYGKDATNPLHKWTNADEPEVTDIFDSLAYKTSTHGCDSIFYLKLHITQNIIMPTEYDTICQGEVYEGWKEKGHILGIGHRMSKMNLKTDEMIFSANGEGSAATFYSNAETGNFELRDTLVSKVYPYPDSIHVLRLHVSYKPTITLTSRNDSLCEAVLPAPLTWTVKYSALYADSIYYWLKSGDYSSQIKADHLPRGISDTEFDIEGLNTLKDGTYHLIVQAVNDTTCESVKDTVPLVIKNRPSVKVADIAAQCYPAQPFDLSMTLSDVSKVVYSVDGKIDETEKAIPSTLTIDPTGWTAGIYTLRVRPISALGCDSTEVVKEFVIHTQPTATVVSVANQCDNETETTVTYATTNADTCYYFVKSLGEGSKHGVKKANEGNETFDLDISTLNCTGTTDYIDTLYLISVSDKSCLSDTSRFGFTIYAMPEANITSTTESLSGCAPYGSDLVLSYSTPNATEAKWKLTTPLGSKTYDFEAVGTSFVIPQDSLVQPGNYTIEILAVKSAHDCVVNNPAGCSVSFKMNHPAKVTMYHIDSVCAAELVSYKFTVEYTDSYTYTVTSKAGGIVKGGSAAPIATTDGTYTVNIASSDTLPAGTYVLTLQATNSNNCGSDEVEKEFTINPIPAFTSFGTMSAVCETEEPNREVTFAGTNIESVSYELKRGTSTPWVAADVVAGSVGKITLRTDTLQDGTYTLYATPISEHGCTGTQQTTTLTVHPQPLITLTDPGDACEKDKSISVNFTLEDAGTGTYTYTLYNPSNVAVIGPTNKAATASGTISLDISELSASASDYTLKVNAVSNHGCKAVEKQVTFKINTKPQAQLVSVPEQCDNETSTTVTYNTTNADTCYYYIKSLGKGTMKGVKKSNGANGTFDLDISALNCVGTNDWVDTLFLVSNTATCHSDTAKMAFIIRVLPTLTLSTLNVDTCYPVAKIKVPYTSTNASKYSYTLTKDGESTPRLNVSNQNAAASGTIELNTSGLEDGTYHLSVTCVSSGCNIATASLKDIKILKQPTLTLTPLANDEICETEVPTLTVNYTMTAASKYNYELKRGTTSVVKKSGETAPSIELKADTLQAGSYSLVVTAIADNDCGSQTQELTFKVNPQPKVRIIDANRNNSICENNDDEAVWTVGYTSSDADTLTWWLKNNDYSSEIKTGGIKNPLASGGTFALTGMNTLNDGTYHLIVRARSAKLCTSKLDTVPLVINNKPEITVGITGAQCYPAGVYTVSYTHVPGSGAVDSLEYTVVYGSSATVKLPMKRVEAAAFTIDATNWSEANTYSVKVRPISPVGCYGPEQVCSLVIHPKPTVSNLQVANLCQTTGTTATFSHTHGTNYEYWIKNTTKHGTGALTDPNASITADINTLDAGNYTLRVVAKSVNDCVSDTAEKDFTIWPLPTMTLSTDNIDECYPADTVTLPFTHTEATKYQYTITKQGGGMSPVTSSVVNIAAGKPIYLLTTGLTDGTYDVEITAWSEHDCQMATTRTRSFKIYPQPAITSLGTPANVCQKTATVGAAITMTGEKYKYEVYKQGVAAPVETQTNPKTETTITLNTATWAAGTYTLKVTALSDKDCGSDVEQREFVIYPEPVFTFAEDTVVICHGDANAKLAYHLTEKGTYGYTVVGESISGVAIPSEAGDDTITVSTGTLAVGTYKVKAIATSEYLCSSEPDTVVLVVGAVPTLTLGDINYECHPAVTITVPYTQTDAKTLEYDLYQGAVMKRHGSFTVDGGSTFTADVSGLDAGNWSIKVKAVSALGCESGEQTKPFSLIAKPAKPDGITVTPVCEGSTQEVGYHGLGAYEYWIYQGATEKKHNVGSATPSGGLMHFNMDISGLAGGDYTLRLIALSATCPSDTATRVFTIYPRAKFNYTSIAAELTTCYPAGEMTVKYEETSGYATKLVWTLEPSDPNPAYDRSATVTPLSANGSFVIDLSGLPAGEYFLAGSVYTDHCNNSVTQKVITIQNQPTCSIAHIDSICPATPTVPVTITTTLATNYSFVVKDKDDATVDSGSGATTGSTATPVTTGFAVATATLAAGDYTVYVDVTNSGTGCASKQDTTVFTINPTPSITLAKPDSVCEGTATLEVPFATKSHTKTVSYNLMKGTTPTGITGTDVNVTLLNALTLSIGALNEGEYRLYVTPTSEHGCVGAEVDTTFYIKNKPDFAITPEDHCAKDTFMYLTYTASADARTYTYHIYTVGGSSTPVLSAVDKKLDGSPIKVNILSLPAANYRIEAHATSDLGCQSDPDTKFFEIFTKPDANVTSMESVCEGSATAKATFTSANATSYYYEVEGTTPKISGTGLVADGNTFDVPVATLVASNVDKPYNLLFVTKSTTCESDTIRKPFAIWHIPAVTIDSVNDKCVGDLQTTVWCQPDDYTTQALLSLKRGATPVITDSTVTLSATHKTFNIRIDALPVGVYTVELTPRSVHPTTTCTGAMVTGTFEIHPLPTISALTLDSAAVCEGTDSIHATFNHTGAASYSYELRRSGTTAVLRSGNKTGLTDATSKIGIDLLAPSELPTAQSYDLSVTMRSAFGCVKTETATFVIRKNPVVTLSQTYDRQCQPVDSIKIHYTNQGADNFRWEVRNAANTLIKKGTKLDISAEDDWTIRFTNRLDSGAYTLKVVPANACPGDEKSITFHVDTVIPIKTDVTICHGERYDWVIAADCDDKPDTLMRGLTATTHQMDTFYCGEGHCNKVYELNLAVLPEYAAKEESHILCQDEVWNWRGMAITEAGAYADTVHGVAAGGCDSIYRVQVSKVEPVVREESTRLCYGEDLLFNGKTYKNLSVGQTVLFDTIASKAGCDSVYLRLNVQVGNRYYDSVTVTECERYTWSVDGNTYTRSGIYRAEFATAEGCDSVYVLNLTINDKYEYYEAYDILDTQFPITVHDYTYNEDGTYTRPFTSQGGCDSIYHFTITSHPLVLPKDTIHPVICQSSAPYSWRDTTLSNSGWFIKKTTVDGKDTIHVLHLTINPTYSDTTYVHECDSYTWHGTPYTASGTYSFNASPSLCGCDSVEVLVLTLGHTTNATVNATVCQYEMTTLGNRTFVPNETTPLSFNDTLRNASGCDSVITYNVTVTPRTYTMPDDMFSFCEGKTYTWHGHTYDERGTYYDSVMDPNGCTTVIHTLHLTANPRYIFDEDVEVSERALPYVWRGHLGDTLLRTNGDYYERLATAMSCDSIHHIHFHVNWVSRDTVQKQGCESFTWDVNGKTYTESGLYSDTIFTDAPTNTEYSIVHFCDLTIYHGFSETELDFTVCRNESFTWHGQNYAANQLPVGDYALTTADHTIHGCDSVYTATVHVLESFSFEESYEACPGELPYIWRGQLLTTAGTYTDAHVSTKGCDSVYTMTFSVKTVTAPSTETATICLGKNYTWTNGNNLVITGNEPGNYTYYHWYTVPGECDETYCRLDLTVTDPSTPIVTNATICYSESFDWIVPGCDGETPTTLMAGLTETTHEQVMLDCPGTGCNPIYELNLTVLPEYAETDAAVHLCADNTYSWRGGQTLTEAGDYEYRVSGVAPNGCDSVYKISVTKLVPEQKSTEQTVCYGEPIEFNNKTYEGLMPGKTILRDTLRTEDGCDSVYLRLYVTVGSMYYDSVTRVECDKYLWDVDGNTYTSSGIYYMTTATSYGCDSVHVLNLTINPSYDFYETYDIAESELPFTVHEYSYPAAGDYVRTFTSSAGCDSTYHITINTHVVPLPKDTMLKVICQSDAPFTWYRNGKDYINSGWYSVTESDSIHVLHLTVNKTYSDTTRIEACDSYMWQGTTYTASGIYPLNHTSSCGCDSSEVLALTINHPTAATMDVTVCQYELTTIGNQTFVASELTYAPIIQTLTSVAGCDSVITYNVSVTPRTIMAPDADSFCESTTYTWRGHTYSEAGVYFDSVVDPNGCTTELYTLHLTANLKYQYDEDVEVSELALPYKWYGHLGDTLLSTNGDYYDRYSTINGCDSIYHIHFHVNFVTRDTVTIADCDSVLWPTTGKYYSEPGIVSDTVFTDAEHTSYDVIHFCDVTIYPKEYVVEPDITIYSTDTLLWHCGVYIDLPGGDTTITSSSVSDLGCELIYSTTLHVIKVYNMPESYSACPTELPYNWRGQLLTTAGTYTDSLVSILGYDSIYVMNFSVQSVTPPDTIADTLCIGAIKDWYDMSIQAINPGQYTYYKYYTAPGECDSTFHRLNLTVGEVYNVGVDTTVHVCYGESYNWYGIERAVAVTAANLQPDGTFRMMFDTIKHTYLGCDSLEAHLTLIMHQPYNLTLPDTTICNYYNWGAMYIDSTGTYTQTFDTYFGCTDSVVTRTFTVYYSPTVTLDSVVACDSYRWRGEDYTTSGLKESHVTQMDGSCDSIYFLPLTIYPTLRDTITLDWWCSSFAWGETGETYSATGIYEGSRHPLSTGCDSIPYLRLTLHDSIVTHQYDTACVTYTWPINNLTYTGSTDVRYVQSSVQTGCDSAIHYLHLVINQPSPATFDTTTVCRQFSDGIRTYTTTTDDTLALPNMYGCDSLIYRHIIVNHPDTVYDTIATCNTYTRYASTEYEQTFTYSQDVQINDFECDSVIMLHITLNHDKDTAVFVTAWDTYTWHGKTYTQSMVDEDTLLSAVGCDSIVTLNLILNSSMDTIETQLACESFYWPWNDSTYTGSTVDTLTKRIDVGLLSERDSTRILHLTIDTTTYTAFDSTVCFSCVWHGVEYTSDTTVFYRVPGLCDSYDTLHLTVYHEQVVDRYDTVCDVMTIFGETFYSDTTITRMGVTEYGCDLTTNYHITVNHRTTQTIYVDTCSSYTWEGDTYTRSGNYTKVLTGATGCDSVVTLVLSIYSDYRYEFDAISCQGYYVWDNVIYDTEGDYDSTYISASGCDSIVTMHLTLPQTIMGEWLDTLVCDALLWNGRLYTESGQYTETLTSLVTGCDSIARLDLHVAANATGEFSETAQTSYTWGSETYYTSGDYVKRFPIEGGCDSIVTLHLTITNPMSMTQISDTACDAYTWDTETFYTSGVYTRNFPTIAGEDSIVELSLVIMHDTAVSIVDAACEQYMWNSTLYTESGTYTQILTRASGCDSVVTLTLTIHEPFATEFDVTARDVYTWDNESFTASGDYMHSYTTVHGCDSTATLHLTIISNAQTELNDTACTSYAWADSIYMHSTVHTKVYTASNGCDSVVTLNLIVHEPIWTELYDTACAEIFIFAGDTLSHTGIYYDTLTSAITGCDSIVMLHLQWCTDTLCIDSISFTVDSVCTSYVWDGMTYSNSGSYTRHYRLDNGCDSVVTMRLNIQPTYRSVTDTMACDSLLWQGEWYYESGFYYDTLQAVSGCDSVLILHATIGKSGSDSIVLTSCDAKTINGSTYSESGIYYQHLTTISGCDSLLTINLTITKSVDTIIDEIACDTLIWQGDTITASGYYPLVLQSDSTGCDSVVNLHLIVYESKQTFIIDSLHCDSIIWGDDYTGVDTLYVDSTYTKVFRSSVGCDSTVTMDLRLLRHDFITAPDTAACDSFVWNGRLIDVTGTYYDTLTNSRTGCDSVTMMFITINPTLYTDTIDTVAPPYYVWPLNGDTIWSSGDYVDTVPSVVTGCDSIVALHLIMTDSILLDPSKPLAVDTFGYCQGDTAEIRYNLTKGHPLRYRLLFNYSPDVKPEQMIASVVDTTDLPNHGMDTVIHVFIPERCKPGAHHAELQLFDDYSMSDVYEVVIYVSIRGVIVTLWNDVVAINNYSEEYIGYQWFIEDDMLLDATKQYYSDGEELNACYRTRLQLAADSSFIYTCLECFDLTTDSLQLIVYPTPAPVGMPVTIKAQGILLSKLIGSTLTIYDAHGNVVHTNTNMTQRTEVVTLPSGLYIATLITAEAEPRSATAKFTVF